MEATVNQLLQRQDEEDRKPLLRMLFQIKPKIYDLQIDDPIDVIIPCTEKDLPTLDLCIQGIRNFGSNIRRIIVISSAPLTQHAEWFDESLFPFSKFDIALAMFGHSRQATEYMNSAKTRIGWIYQQFLKLYSSFVIPDISSNVLSLDADTIFLRSVSFMNKQGGAAFNVGIEYHPPYFQHMSRVLPWLTQVMPPYSGISHQMLFQKSLLEDFFSEIRQAHKRELWEVLSSKVDRKHIFRCFLSEYEMYFNFCFLKTDQVSIRPLKFKNIQQLDKLDKYRQQGFYHVSAHSWDRQ